MIRCRATAVLLLAFTACERAQAPAPGRLAAPGGALLARTDAFRDYWRQGKAEISRFDLEQARYGERHRGHAVLIFVVEDFRLDRQVKSEIPGRGPAIPVLKLNFLKKFVTGLYSYSMMASVFTPLDLAAHPRTPKVTASSQEWCGHTWLQLNLRGGLYRATSHSYFEDEADESFALPATWLEDEVWTYIRLAPASLPRGRVRIVPGALSTRLRHRKPAVEDAIASLAPASDPARSRYTIEYPAARRTLTIEFARAFPHEILAFEETYPDPFGARTRMLTSRATRTHSMRVDYWNRNRVQDRGLRERLGLP